MIAVDTNILIYAHREEATFHAAASKLVSGLAEGPSPWAVPWPCVHEFLAVVTNRRIFALPTPQGRALDQVEAWLESPSVLLLAEPATHWTALRRLIEKGRIVGPRVHDARIAALCIEHGVRELWTADRDFGRFATVKVVNPLIQA